MKFFAFSLRLGFVVAALFAGTASAAPETAAPTASPVPMAGASQLVSHRAIYNVALASIRNGGKVTDVSGKMFYEWKDVCDGWTLEQRFQLHFSYTQADEMDTATNYATWESKDGLAYRFNVRKYVNGTMQSESRGDATLSKPGGSGMAHYQTPKARDEALPAGAIFPTTHTLQLLTRAAAGDRFINRDVFDGTDDDAITEINAYIGAKSEASLVAMKTPGVDKDGLLKGPAWNIRMAFFPISSKDASPDYEMDMTMLQNGIAQSMMIDYGDFAISATLERIESVPAPGC